MNYKSKIILYLSLLLVLSKWIFLIYLNNNQDIIANVIENIEDWQYFTLIYNLSNFNFSPTYDPKILDSNYLPIPIYSILFHSIAFKFFNIYGFMIVEFFAILLFFILLNKIFHEIGLTFNLSIVLSLFIFSIPNLIHLLNFDQIQYLNVSKELYNLRIPRPLITHLYLFFFFYLLISIKKIDQFDFKRLALIGSLFAFMWGSFYINLAISGLIFLMYYFLVVSKKKIRFKLISKDFLLIGFFFLIFSIPLILLIFVNVEPDYVRRVGLIDLSLTEKRILIFHFLSKIFSIKFVIVFVIITTLNYLLKNKKIYDEYNLNLLYIIFLSSFLAPLIFIIFSPKISEVYHFSNMIVALSFFILLIHVFLFLNLVIKNDIFSKTIISFFIFLLLCFYALTNFTNIDKNLKKNKFIHANELIKVFESQKFNKNTAILTFDGKIQSNLILKGYKNLNIVLGINTSLNDEILENKIIASFDFLNLELDDFKKFIQNEKQGWRYINNNIGKTFYMKYQANKLITFKNSIDFSQEERIFIQKSSPLHSQQLIIPNFEIKRLISKFSAINKPIQEIPEIIIINNNDFFSKNVKINKNLFCHKIINETYEIFYDKKLNQCI